MRIACVVNGQPVEAEITGATTLAQVIRVEFGLYGTKIACGFGECGACTVLLDGKPINACIFVAAKADGRSIRTVESLGTPEDLSELQRSFVEEGGFQCGFCTPGHVMRARALLDEIHAGRITSESEAIRYAIAGNICRCTGYDKIVEAIARAAATEE